MAAKKSKKISKNKKEIVKKDQEELDEKLEDQDPDDEISNNNSRSIFSNPKFLYAFVILAVLAFVIWQVKSIFVAAMVNNEPITRVELINELESRYGEQVLDTMITQRLVEQAAKEQDITVSDEEVNAQIDDIRGQVEQQGSTLEDALALQGQTEENLREGVRYSILVEKIFEGQVEITNEQVQEYYEENKELYGEDTNFEDIQGQLREQMVQQQLSGRFQEWLQNRREEATIRQFVDF